MQKQKDKLHGDRQEEELRRREKNMQMKQQMHENLQKQKTSHYVKVKSEADRIKQEKAEQRELIEHQRMQDQQKTMMMKEMVKK